MMQLFDLISVLSNTSGTASWCPIEGPVPGFMTFDHMSVPDGTQFYYRITCDDPGTWEFGIGSYWVAAGADPAGITRWAIRSFQAGVDNGANPANFPAGGIKISVVSSARTAVTMGKFLDEPVPAMANDDGGIAIGRGAVALGVQSMALHHEANAAGLRSMALGRQSSAGGEDSTAIGRGASTHADAVKGIALGGVALKPNSVAGNAFAYANVIDAEFLGSYYAAMLRWVGDTGGVGLTEFWGPNAYFQPAENTTYFLHGQVVGIRNGDNKVVAHTFTAIIQRIGAAAPVVLSGPTTADLFNDSGATYAFSAVVSGNEIVFKKNTSGAEWWRFAMGFSAVAY